MIFGRNNSGKSSILGHICRRYEFDDHTPVDYIGLNRNYSPTEYDYINEGGADRKSRQRENRRARIQREPAMHQIFDWVEELSLVDDEMRESTMTWLSEHFEQWQLEPQTSGKHIIGYRIRANGNSPLTQGNGARSVFPIIIQLYNPEIKVLAIDEPEFGLEAGMQRKLFKAIRDASLGLSGFPKKRIAISTHSQLFLDRSTPANNFRLAKQEGKVELRHLDTPQDLEEAAYQMLGITPTDVFYPSNIIIVEGWTDQCYLLAVYNLMLQTGAVQMPRLAVHVLNGIDNAQAGATAIEQVFSTLNYTPVYRNRICAVFDQPEDENDKAGSKKRSRKLG